jgi:hypothetical protein
MRGLASNFLRAIDNWAVVRRMFPRDFEIRDCAAVETCWHEKCSGASEGERKVR